MTALAHQWRIAERARRKKSRLPDESFRCHKLHCDLPRADCAARWEAFNTKRQRTEGTTGCACSGCAVGREHHAGRIHPDAVVVQLKAKPSDKPIKRRQCMSCGATLPWGRTVSCSAACGSERRQFEAMLILVQAEER